MELKEGQILAGKYRIERVLGQGGMGIVVAATHLQLGKRVALKFLLPEALRQVDAAERFGREARAAVKITSEHVARVSDVGVLDTGSPYMVMEYLHGSDLAAWLVQRGPLPIEQAVQFLLQACEAIAEAHVLGIVHRDLQPANLFVVQRADGALTVKVLDFGISKSTGFGGSRARIKKTSAAMRSPLYMSPELMRSAKDVDPRSDIWALGAVLQELITGVPPFQAGSLEELVLRVVTAPPTLLRDVCPDAPAALEGVIIKCLEKDPELRYPTVGALAAALREFAPRRSRASTGSISGILSRADLSPPTPELPLAAAATAAADASPSTSVPPWEQSTPPGTNRRRTRLIVSALLAVLLLFLSGLAMHHALSVFAFGGRPSDGRLPTSTKFASVPLPDSPPPPDLPAARRATRVAVSRHAESPAPEAKPGVCRKVSSLPNLVWTYHLVRPK